MTNPPQLPAQLALEIESRYGRGWSLAALGASERTWAVRAGEKAVGTIKTLRPDRRPEDVCRALAMVRAHGVACPALLASAPASAGWLALFEHVDGEGPDPCSESWTEVWLEALALLRQLSAIRERVAWWDLESEWLDAVAPAADENEVAADLLHRLREDRAPDGDPCLAHGDFAPQNFVLGSGGGCTLIDWEELGYARPGFDAGWLLGLNRIGAGPRWPQAALLASFMEMGLSASNLSWFEGMGLLRMLSRARSRRNAFERELIVERLLAAIREFGGAQS